MVLWSFHDLRPGSPILNINSEALVGWWTLRPVLIIYIIKCSTWWITTLLIFLTWWSTVGCPETSEAWRVHLFLEKIAWVGIMYIVILYSLNQIRLILMSVEWTPSSWFIISNINIFIIWWYCITLSRLMATCELRKLSLRILQQLFYVVRVLFIVDVVHLTVLTSFTHSVTFSQSWVV